MLIAVQEDVLAGNNILEKFETAKHLRIQGIEFWGRILSPKVPEIIQAVEQTGVKASSVNHGDQSRVLGADPVERDRALAELRQSLIDVAAIGAKGVIFVPHPFGSCSTISSHSCQALNWSLNYCTPKYIRSWI